MLILNTLRIRWTEYAAANGAKNIGWVLFYKDCAPTALKPERRNLLAIKVLYVNQAPFP